MKVKVPDWWAPSKTGERLVFREETVIYRLKCQVSCEMLQKSFQGQEWLHCTDSHGSITLKQQWNKNIRTFLFICVGGKANRKHLSAFSRLFRCSMWNTRRKEICRVENGWWRDGLSSHLFIYHRVFRNMQLCCIFKVMFWNSKSVCIYVI